MLLPLGIAGQPVAFPCGRPVSRGDAVGRNAARLATHSAARCDSSTEAQDAVRGVLGMFGKCCMKGEADGEPAETRWG